ncbi:MAG: helix-turn-helix transcriptional regulator [Ilumatobacteraceae bacterium]
MRTDTTNGHLELLLLGVLADGPAHGYAIVAALKDRSSGVVDVPEGSLYPALHRLEDDGRISSEWRPVGGRRRREYQLTETGRDVLQVQRRDWRRLADAIDQVLARTTGRTATLAVGGTA